jgi:alditol oxidase
VTRIALDAEPAYEIRQHVFEGLSWDALLGDDVFAAGYSVSVFTRWLPEEAGQLWVKQRAGEPEPDGFGARPATVDRHPILGLDPVNCTPQLGRPGRWSDRLPHFRMGFTPSAGDELQTEYLVDRRHARTAIEAVRALGPEIEPLLQVSELRTVAADRLWMSPQYGRDTLAIHFTWKPVDVDRALERLEAALAPFDMRPHWGKLFGARGVGARYERLADFTRLTERLDPRGAFRNDWLQERVLGP